jgi:hypothetical protein
MGEDGEIGRVTAGSGLARLSFYQIAPAGMNADR